MTSEPASDPDKNKMKQLALDVMRLKHDLAVGDTSRLAGMLDGTPSPEMLVMIREQKILFRVRDVCARGKIIERLAGIVAIALDDVQRRRYANYLEFVNLAVLTNERLNERRMGIQQRVGRLSFEEMLCVAREFFDVEFATLRDQRKPVAVMDTQNVAERERNLQDMSGALNDLYAAIGRVVGEASHVVRRTKPYGAGAGVLAGALTEFGQLVVLAGEQNSLDYAVDMVSFGEWYVEEIRGSPESYVRLNYVDPRLNLLRTLAIRRHLVLMHAGHRQRRLVRDHLASHAASVLRRAIRYFEEKTRPVDLTEFELLEQEARAKNFLLSIDAEDDLLFAAARGSYRLAAFYTAAAAIRWFAQGADIVRRKLPERLGRQLKAPRIPFDVIVRIFANTEDKREVFEEALRAASVVTPVGRHSALLKRPFVIEKTNAVRTFVPAGVGLWNVAVREAIIDGGVVGKNLGEIWEDFLAHTFEQAQWKVVGKRIRLRRGGLVVSEIDLLVLKYGLLLVAQIKAVTGPGETPYGFWKNRLAIQAGCRQARSAAQILVGEPERLRSIASGKIADEVERIVPVVFTNADELDGCLLNGVPVLGEVGRKSITRGSSVDFIESHSGKILETKHFVREEDLSLEKVLWILDHPVETLIAPEEERVRDEEVKLSDIHLVFPAFDLRESKQATLKTT